MAQTVKLKRSAVSGNVPTTSDLALGEIAINTYDGNIFIKKNDGSESIVTFSAGGNAGSIEEDSFTGNGNTTAFTISTAPSTEENLLVFIDAAFQNRDSFTVSGTTVTFDTAPDNGSSVRIYHVIPGSVDDGILTVAKFAASAIVTEAEGISSNDNDTTIPTSAAVKDYVDTQVATVDTLPEVLANGNTTGGTDIAVSAADDITFTDTSKAIFGTDSDLELYHNGSNAFLTNSTGDLYIQDTNGSIRIRPKTGESGIDVLADGAVNLYYDNTSVLSTTADGISVTSEVEASEFIGDLRGAVLFKAQAGENVTKGDVVYISGISGNTTVVSKADADDASKMPAFGIVAATTTSGQPVDIYTQGILGDLDTSSYSEGDELFVSTTAGALTSTPPTGETAAIQKIAKVTRSNALSGSIFITGAGRSNAVPNLDQDQFFLGNASNQAIATDFSDAVEALSINNVVEDTTPQLGGDLASNGNDILFADSDKAIFGAGSDLQIYHNGNNSFIDEVGTGRLYIRAADNLTFSNTDTTKTYANFENGGAAKLYHNSALSILTTTAGAEVREALTVGSSNNDLGTTAGDQLTPLTLRSDTANIDSLLFTTERLSTGTTWTSAAHKIQRKVDSTLMGYMQFGANTSDLVTFGEGSTEYVRIDGDGNVGIGTTSPERLLHVEGTDTIVANFENTTATGEARIYATAGTAVGHLSIAGNSHATLANTLSIASPSTTRFVNSGVEVMHLLSSGDVGIGTDSPNVKLVVSEANGDTALAINDDRSNVADYARIDFRHNNITGSQIKSQAIEDFSVSANRTSDLSFHTRNNGTIVDAMHIQEDGNVGIGTSNPNRELELSAANPRFRMTDTDGGYAEISGNTGHLALQADVGNTQPGSRIDFEIDGGSQMRLLTSGLGIGTTAPSEKLGVAPDTDVSAEIGRAHIGAVGHNDYAAFSHVDTDATNSYALLQGAAGQTYLNSASGQKLRFRINNSNVAEFDSSGNFAIGVTNPSAKFQVEEYGIDTTETSTTATTQVAIHTFAATTFRSARFTIQVTNSTDSTYHLTEILMIHDGTTPSITEYGTIFTGAAAEATFDADISSGNVRLLATPASTDTMEFKVVSHSITT